MQSHILKRHKETPGCVWQPGMVGPGCRPPSALKRAAMAGHDSYYEMEKYSRITTWLLLAIVGVVMIRNLVARARHSSRRSFAVFVLKFPGYSTAAAVCRGVGYYRPTRFSSRYSKLNELLTLDRMTSLGNTLAVALPSLGLICWCFAVKPYYRPAAVWGSTPLGVRSGMIANALFPFLFCFGLKFNPLTLVTGISHEKLQVYHQWTARVILFFSIVHTVAFLWQPVHDGGFSNLKAWYYYDKVWWTGTVSLAFFAWLVLSSFGYFRRMSYRFFVLQHIFSILLFLVFYFMHTRDLLSSWAWLWPTIGLWGFHVLFKFANSLRISKFVGIPATITMLDDGEDLMRMVTTAPVTWQPGQHFFVRFPSLGTAAPFQSHPFTVTNLPSADPNSESRLVFYFKARDGLTREIWRQGQQSLNKEGPSSTLTVALDGPYGSAFEIGSYHSTLLIAGGIGVTAVLPLMMQLCTTVGTVRAPFTRKVTVIWCVQSAELLNVFGSTLQPMLEHLRSLGLDVAIEIHCRSKCASSLNDKEKDGRCVSPLGPDSTISYERAVIPQAIERFVKDSSSSPSIGVSVCGPASMLNETSNTVSRLQWSQVVSSSTALKEIYLHTETFDW